MNNKKLTMALASIVALVVGSCGGSDENGPSMTKEEARAFMKADNSFDWCEYFGWYGDGVCDTFCLLPDPDCEEPPDGLHKPVCDAIGSRSEGWYWEDTEELIKFENCADMSEPECEAIGSRSEGWYSDNGLITWDSCHRTVRVAVWGESCGPSIGYSCHTGLYCQGLPGPGVIGGSGECLYTGSCKIAEDCSAEGNDWVHPMCVGYASCESGQCAWHCGSAPAEVWSWTTVLLADVESEHPYNNNTERTWTVHRDGAAKMRLNIDRMEVEYNYDFVSVYVDGQEDLGQVFDGVHNNVWTREFDTDTLYVTLNTDYSVTGWGFKMASVSYYEKLPEGLCNTDADCADGQFCNPHQCFNPYEPCYGDCQDGQGGGQQGGTFTSIQKYDVPDNDPAGITSPLEVQGLAECDLDVSVDVRIRHSYVGDLVVGLTDPSGARVVLWNREGGGQQDLALEGFSLPGQLAQSGGNGTWVLDVSDHAWMDTGTLETWTLNLDCR